MDHPDYEFKNVQKGINGSVLIIGGSKLYVGAVYSVGISCLLTGCDLVYIFSGKSALIPLKSLLPEAVVCRISYQEWILKRINICILGPGLSIINNKNKLEKLNRILEYLQKRDIILLIDSDGLRNMEKLNIKDFKNVIFTPNKNETKFLKPLAAGQYAIFKGVKDQIMSCDGTKINIEDKSCGKRCGGQGDLLCGIIASLIIKSKHTLTKKVFMNSMSLACKILRRAGYLAYIEKGVSTISRDIIDQIPNAFNEIIFVKKLQN